MLEPKQGWRTFCCEACGRAFEVQTRYARGVSLESCICGEECRPLDYRVDPTIPVDAFSNLIHRPEEREVLGNT